MGNKRVPCLILVTIAIIIWLSLINAQIFGYNKDFTPDCEDVAGGHFSSFLQVNLRMAVCKIALL